MFAAGSLPARRYPVACLKHSKLEHSGMRCERGGGVAPSPAACQEPWFPCCHPLGWNCRVT